MRVLLVFRNKKKLWELEWARWREEKLKWKTLSTYTVSVSLSLSLFSFCLVGVIEKFGVQEEVRIVCRAHLFVNHPSNHLCWLLLAIKRRKSIRKKTNFRCLFVSHQRKKATHTEREREMRREGDKAEKSRKRKYFTSWTAKSVRCCCCWCWKMHWYFWNKIFKAYSGK